MFVCVVLVALDVSDAAKGKTKGDPIPGINDEVIIRRVEWSDLISLAFADYLPQRTTQPPHLRL